MKSYRESMEGENGYFYWRIITPEQYPESNIFASRRLPVCTVKSRGLIEPIDMIKADLIPLILINIIRGGFFTQFFKGAIILERHVLSVLVKNSSGVLTRVSGLFARRGFNIDSLSVGRTENPNISRMTIALMGGEDVLEQFIKQLNKVEEVLRVLQLKPEESVYRELVLIKVKATPENRSAINEVVKIFRSKIIDVAPNTLTIELTGDDSKITALIKLMEEYGIQELVRTGISGLERGDKDITNYGEYFN